MSSPLCFLKQLFVDDENQSDKLYHCLIGCIYLYLFLILPKTAECTLLNLPMMIKIIFIVWFPHAGPIILTCTRAVSVRPASTEAELYQLLRVSIF